MKKEIKIWEVEITRSHDNLDGDETPNIKTVMIFDARISESQIVDLLHKMANPKGVYRSTLVKTNLIERKAIEI